MGLCLGRQSTGRGERMNPREDRQGPFEEPREAGPPGKRLFSLDFSTTWHPQPHNVCASCFSSSGRRAWNEGCGVLWWSSASHERFWFHASSLEGLPGLLKSTGRERPLVSEKRQCSSWRGGGTEETAQGTRAR